VLARRACPSLLGPLAVLYIIIINSFFKKRILGLAEYSHVDCRGPIKY